MASQTRTKALLCLIWVTICPLLASAFLPANIPHVMGSSRQSVDPRDTWRFYLSNDKTITTDDKDPLEGLDDTRRQNLFQALLRDLQIEGVPLLEYDVSQAHTLQAALWTTMAELSEEDDGEKVCLVLQDMGVDALKTFVDDFSSLKKQDRLMEYLPELKRFNVTMVGKGVGPAIVIETANKTSSNSPEDLNQESGFRARADKITKAMESFIYFIIAGEEVCPYTKSPDTSPEGLGVPDNIQSGRIGYRFCGFSDVCHVLSTFWDCICELLLVEEYQQSSTVLTMPAIGAFNGQQNDPSKSHERFTAVAELISRSLCLFRGNDIFNILYFDPNYDRRQVSPVDGPAHGHLPPVDWLRPILRKNGNLEEADSLSDDDLMLSNYQRRSPFPAVVIKRVSPYFDALGTETEIDLDGQIQKVSGVSCYANNAIRLAKIGEETLRSGLNADIKMGQ